MSSEQRYVDPSRVSRAEAISRRIEAEIVETGISAGTRLGTKEELRKRFSVAPGTVNEALKILEMRGLVDARPGPGGGVFVSSPTARTRLSHMVLGFDVAGAPFSDCLVVRNALEPLVCREAARHCNKTTAKALRGIIADMEQQLDDPVEYLRLNWHLHRKLAAVSENATLKSLYLTLLDYVESGITDVHPDELLDLSENLEIHRRLVEAIVAGPGAELDVAIDRHTPVVEQWGDQDA